MEGIVRSRYSGPDVLVMRDVDMPATRDGEVLVRVLASSVSTPVSIGAMACARR